MKTCVLFPKAFSYNYMSGSVAHSFDIPSSYELYLNPNEIASSNGSARTSRRNLSLVSRNRKVEKDVSTMPRLLHVEDSPQIRLLVSIFLKNDFNIDSVHTGEEAVQQASENSYDFVLMDVDLGQGIDGFETTRRIREISGYEKTPIIALTTNDYNHVRGECITSRMNAYIQKPFDKSYLLGTIREMDKHI